MDATVALLAGMVSTAVFAGSVLPMLAKAVRSRDLSSYSFGNLVLANLGNAVHSVYVFSLPAGPIWVLHSFYVLSSGLMLAWYLRWGRPERAQLLGEEGGHQMWERGRRQPHIWLPLTPHESHQHQIRADGGVSRRAATGS
jgi:hypothetical protein